MLKASDIVNSAGTRTVQARVYIVRVPAVVRIVSPVTYPHYRGTPTVVSFVPGSIYCSLLLYVAVGVVSTVVSTAVYCSVLK